MIEIALIIPWFLGSACPFTKNSSFYARYWTIGPGSLLCTLRHCKYGEEKKISKEANKHLWCLHFTLRGLLWVKIVDIKSREVFRSRVNSYVWSADVIWQTLPVGSACVHRLVPSYRFSWKLGITVMATKAVNLGKGVLKALPCGKGPIRELWSAKIACSTETWIKVMIGVLMALKQIHFLCEMLILAVSFGAAKAARDF